MTPPSFDHPASVAGYHANLATNVPGLPLLHQLTDQLLAERVPAHGRVLVVGAGGGAELLQLAAAHPTWTFDGVDPSEPMLQLAAHTLGEHAPAATLHHGYVDDAPSGPFDAATCLLVLHFLSPDERAHTLSEIRRRLRPGSPLITFHHSVPAGAEREAWFRHWATYALGTTGDPQQINARAAGMAANLPALSPEEDEQLLAAAGFTDIATFMSALTLRGWVAYA